MTRHTFYAIVLFVSVCIGAPAVARSAPPASTQPALRVAVIGGMSETGFWQALCARFTAQTGVAVTLVATGPKALLYAEFRRGTCDLITMHSSDTIMNLVADGLALDPQPWMKNDLVIVGPDADPAGVRGMADPLAALKKIIDTKSPFVVHASLGAQEVLRDILAPADLSLDPEHTTVLLEDRQRTVLQVAADKHAYTLVGRIPFRSGKLPSAGMSVMVQGDPRLRRPYVVAVANPACIAGARLPEARRLAAFLRTSETQAWLSTFGVGKYDDLPLFFPVTLAPPANPVGSP